MTKMERETTNKERQTTNIERSKTMFGLPFCFDKNKRKQ